jgi:hypothetical protein
VDNLALDYVVIALYFIVMIGALFVPIVGALFWRRATPLGAWRLW